MNKLLLKAFKADNVLFDGVKTYDLITRLGLINLDFIDVEPL